MVLTHVATSGSTSTNGGGMDGVQFPSQAAVVAIRSSSERRRYSESIDAKTEAC